MFSLQTHSMSQRPQRANRSTLATDYLAHVFRSYSNLDKRGAIPIRARAHRQRRRCRPAPSQSSRRRLS